ncbi:translation initiation factor IF-2 [Megalodesulfovibrio paquesii]
MDEIRVKELADELRVNAKDILQALRELGHPAKSLVHVLSEEDVQAVKMHLKDHAGGTEDGRRVSNSGVIVRRRRKPSPDAPSESQADVHTEAQADATAEAATAGAPVAGTQSGEPRAAEPQEAPRRESRGRDAGARDAGGKARAARTPSEPTPAARIISTPESQAAAERKAAEERAAAEAAAREAAAKAEREAAEAARAEREAQQAAAEAEKAAPVTAQADQPQEPAATTEPAQPARDVEAPAAEAPAAPKVETAPAASEEDAQAAQRKKKPRPAEGGPQVRIISMPDPQTQARQRSESPRPAGGAGGPGGSGGPRQGQRPYGPRGGAGAPGAPGAPAAGAAPGGAPGGTTPAAPGTESEADRKRGRKDRRVVEFVGGVSDDEDRRRASLNAKKKKTSPLRDKTGGRARPGGKRRRDGMGDYEMVSTTMAEQAAQPLKQAKRKIRVDEAIRVSDMAHQMGVKSQSLIKVLLGLGIMATINSSLDMDTATLVANEFGYEVERVGFTEDTYLISQVEDDPEALKPRPPVVTIMGHVDHGKTSLLDAIRETNVTAGEAGGITQHIGAYHVTTRKGDVVFLDTPGHEAFTAMRARGAQVTDIVVLVVAADDGVMDQTREAVSHARAAGVPIVVAVNKIDKEGADPDRVKRELSDLDLLPEDWGGETIYAHVSAKQRIGIDELLELILLQAEVLELKANPEKPARGHIVEARLDKGRGPVATILVAEGTLRQGDAFVCGVFSGKARALFNDQGKKMKKAGPAWPVEVQGFEGVPEAGDEFVVVEDEKVARRIAETRLMKQREKELAKESRITLETFLARRGDVASQNLNLILKADVQGSLEAVSEALAKLSTDEVKVKVIHSGAGAVSESDVMLASASEAIIIGFNVRPTVKAKDLAERESIDIRFYDIIYQLVSDIKDAMSGMLSPTVREVYLGQAEVRETFSVPKVGTIAGCAVVDGKIVRNAGVRLLRNGVVIYTGAVTSLKRFKDDAKEVLKGYECGIGLEKFNDIKVGDYIEAFEHVEEARTL